MDGKEPELVTDREVEMLKKIVPYFLVGLISGSIGAIYLSTIGLPNTSTKLGDFGSFFGGISTGIGVLIAGLGYMQSARNDQRALENELLEQDLDANASLIRMQTKNLESRISPLIDRYSRSSNEIKESEELLELRNKILEQIELTTEEVYKFKLVNPSPVTELRLYEKKLEAKLKLESIKRKLRDLDPLI